LGRAFSPILPGFSFFALASIFFVCMAWVSHLSGRVRPEPTKFMDKEYAVIIKSQEKAELY
jgi:hypothetical protein